MTVYEVFDSDPPALLASKQQISQPFESGRQAYLTGQISEAKGWFEKCATVLPEDRATQLYLERCHHWESQPLPAHWDGIATLETK